MVFYRKYRPQTIGELDSKDVRDKLTAVLRGDVSHAFLFTGPKGLGKTSTARIVAKVVNCKKRGGKSGEGKENVEPCNKCHQCISITNGSNMDVLEIDGASNRGIDEIRDLREKIRLSPVSANKKVYIIDEVHMLTTEAFNALLKTLEEPPAHALFILCTTEPHKVPATIVSRCLHIAFNRATKEELVASLTRIIKAEKLSAKEDALFQIACLADGSFRDAAKILEEIALTVDGRKITKEIVDKKYQITNINVYIEDLLKHLQKKDEKNALKLVETIATQGVDMKFVIEQLIAKLHENLLVTVAAKDSDFTLDEIKKLAQLLTKAYIELKYAVLPQLSLELAIIEFSQQAPNHAEHYAKPRGDNILSDKAFQRQDGNDNKIIFTKLIDAVKQHNHSLAGVLRGCTIQTHNKTSLVLATNFQFHKERLEDTKSLAILEKAAKEVLGSNVAVSVILNSRGGDL